MEEETAQQADPKTQIGKMLSSPTYTIYLPYSQNKFSSMCFPLHLFKLIFANDKADSSSQKYLVPGGKVGGKNYEGI